MDNKEIWRVFTRLAQFQLIGSVFSLSMVSILSFFGNYYWLFDIVAHFKIYYVLIALVGFGINSFLQQRRLALVCLFLLLVNGISFLPFYLPNLESNGQATPTLTLYMANVKTENRQYELLLDSVEAVEPDLIILEEVDQQWLESIKSLTERYQHILAEPRSDNFGIAILSKYPLLDKKTHWFGSAVRPTLQVTINVSGKDITVLGTHPIPPFSKKNSQLRDEQLNELAKYIPTISQPLMVMGDFNVTPFSAVFKDFMNTSKLSYCGHGHGYQPTWQRSPLLPPLRLALDHCFYSDTIEVLDFYVGQATGSDHLPIVVKIRWK